MQYITLRCINSDDKPSRKTSLCWPWKDSEFITVLGVSATHFSPRKRLVPHNELWNYLIHYYESQLHWDLLGKFPGDNPTSKQQVVTKGGRTPADMGLNDKILFVAV